MIQITFTDRLEVCKKPTALPRTFPVQPGEATHSRKVSREDKITQSLTKLRQTHRLTH